jgi:hypothetical protein
LRQRKRHHLDMLFPTQIYLGSKFCLLFWKMLVFEFLFGITETCLSSTSAFERDIIIVLDALQLLILFLWTLPWLETKLFTRILLIFNSSLFLITKTLIVFSMNVCRSMFVYFSRRTMVGMIALNEMLLSKWHKFPCFVFRSCLYNCFVSFFCSCWIYNLPLSCSVSTQVFFLYFFNCIFTIYSLFFGVLSKFASK